MRLSSAKTRAMMLLKTACDSGKARQAMEILQTSGTEVDGTVNWSAAVPRLKALVEGLPIAASQRPVNGLDVQVVDDMDLAVEPWGVRHPPWTGRCGAVTPGPGHRFDTDRNGGPVLD